MSAAATATAAAEDAVPTATAAPAGSLPASVYHAYMGNFSPSLTAAEIGDAHAVQKQGLTGLLPQGPRTSLRADAHLRASGHGWQQEQELWRTAYVSDDFSNSVFVTGPLHLLSTGGRSCSQQLPGAAAPAAATAVTSTVAATATASVTATATSSTAAAAADAASSEDNMSADRIVLVTMEVKPANVVCRAFGMKKAAEFLSRVDECTPEQRKFFSLADRCNAADNSGDMARQIVSQAAGYAFFTGTRLFMISCYCLHWKGELVTVEEAVGADGKVRLEATVTVGEQLRPATFWSQRMKSFCLQIHISTFCALLLSSPALPKQGSVCCFSIYISVKCRQSY